MPQISNRFVSYTETLRRLISEVPLINGIVAVVVTDVESLLVSVVS